MNRFELKHACREERWEDARALMHKNHSQIWNSLGIFGLPSHEAARHGHLPSLQLMYEIIQRSSDWEKRERRTELAFAEPDMLGDTPIRKAAENGHVDCVKFIVSCVPTAVLDLKKKTEGGTTIAHIAAIRGHVEILEYLAELDPYLLESKTKEKITPLDYAISCGKINAAIYIARTAPSGIKLFLKKNMDGEIALKKTKWEEIRAYFTRKKIQEIGLDRERILSGSDYGFDSDSLVSLVFGVIMQNTELLMYRL